MLYLICIITFSILLLWLLFQKRRKVVLANRLPGPNGNFLIGMLPLYLEGPEKLVSNLLKVYRRYEKSLFKLWIFNSLWIFVTRPEDIDFVLNNPNLLKKSKEYKVVNESIGGQGIFAIEDVKKWKKNRKMVSGSFNFSILKSFLPAFYEEALVLSEILQEKCDPRSNECEISVPIENATMEIIGKTALGVKFNAQRGQRKNPYVENLSSVMKFWEYRITHPWYLSKLLFSLSSVKQKHDRSTNIMIEYVNGIIDKKNDERKANANSENNINTDDEIIHKKSSTFIETLLENYHEMSQEQIRDEISTIIVAGFDTTASTNAFTLYMLSHHQDIQNKVYEELEEIFSVGEYDRQPTYEDLQQMKYLERVIKEALRLYPAILIIARRLDEEIKIGEHLCPAGSTLVISPLYLHSSPLYYDDPETFNPDNFLPEACRDRPHYAYIPFSGGPRSCIGSKFAILQMKMVLSTLVRKNQFFPSDRYPTPKHLRYMFSFILKFVDGVYLKIKPRK